VTWYIDAIDARGGMAVTSERPNNLDTIGKCAEYPVAFISGPQFEPEFIASRGIGLSLARQGHAQLGLFVDQSELKFESLFAVAEFVRRAYLGGASGDGGDESGVPQLPMPEGDGGEREDRIRNLEMGELSADFDSALDPVSLMHDGAREAYKVSTSLKIGQSQEIHFTFTNPATAPKAADPRIERLVRGVVRIAHELMRRNPPAGEAVSLDGLEATDRLLEFMRVTNLWPRYFTPISTFSGFEHTQTLINFLNRYPKVLEEHWHRSRWLASSDPVTDLARLPVPTDCAVPPGANQSLLQLLSAVTAKPHELITNENAFHVGRSELVLLAAAWLNLGSDTASAYWPEKASKAFLVRLCSRAEQWLAGNFPRLMFPPDVEGLIAGSARLPV
jgi:hypothetical protein